jgi:hypothetical protein
MNLDRIAIGNMALANLGVPPVQDFNQKDVASRSLGLRYDEARLQALSTTLWNFASRWTTGVALSIDPKPPWVYVYNYPADALRVFEIQRSTTDEKDIPFEVTDRMDSAGKLIHTNNKAPVFIYTVDKEDVTTFDWDFITALSWLIAHKVAMPITKSVKLRDDCMKMWLALADKAVARTKNEGTADNDMTAGYQAVR